MMLHMNAHRLVGVLLRLNRMTLGHLGLVRGGLMVA